MKAAFQCPDSGLIVAVRHDGQVEGDPSDWKEMGASADAIAATYDWMQRARAALARAKRPYGRGELHISVIEDTLRHLGVLSSDLDPLTR